MKRICFLDFEFSGVVERKVKLVCCATLDSKTNKKQTWWLHNRPSRQSELAKYLKEFDVIVGYSTVAESRSFIALGVDPLEWGWIDEFLEYRMVNNHNDRLQWGKQLVDGKVKTFRKPKPKWEQTEEDKEKGFKATHSLAEATFKLCGEIRDTKHKEKMRDLIISAPKKFTAEEAKAIMAYCLEDVIYLPKIWNRIKEEVKAVEPNLDMQLYFKEALLRGRYSAHTAWMETKGYPIDLKKTKNFSKQVGSILFDLQREINHLFPDITPFRWNYKTTNYSQDQKKIKQWVRDNHNVSRWMTTDSGDVSLSLDAFQKFYDFKHTYPKDNFGAQMVRFAKLKQSLYGFSASGGNRKNFWDSVGSDGRVRPYMNHFGAQSGRSQPAASGFMFLKPAWMRSLVTPDKDHFLASIDYGQQEFLIAALESEDMNMIKAYLSGDPYLYGAKQAGVIPPDGTKDSHKIERDIFKNTYLGILFGMTKYGLAVKLSNDTGKEWSEEDAQEQINIFEDLFPRYMEWKSELISEYQEGAIIKLPCGWKVYADNENPRSVANVPIQGFGASVMRKAVDIAHSRGVSTIFTLHDAIYIEGKVGNERDIGALHDAMREAFVYYFEPHLKKFAEQIKLDPYAWSPAYKKDSEKQVRLSSGEMITVPVSNLYIDARAEDDFNRFSNYFNDPETDLL